MIDVYSDTEGLFPKLSMLKEWQIREKTDKPVHQ